MTADSSSKDRHTHHSSESGRQGDLAAITRCSRAQFEELTGTAVETISGASRQDGSWRLRFEVLELERIPESTSLLGTYEVVVNREGAILEYGRVRRYYRNRADEEGDF